MGRGFSGWSCIGNGVGLGGCQESFILYLLIPGIIMIFHRKHLLGSIIYNYEKVEIIIMYDFMK